MPLVEEIYCNFALWIDSSQSFTPSLKVDAETAMAMGKSLNEIAMRSISLSYALEELNKNAAGTSCRSEEVLYSDAHKVFFYELERFLRERFCGGANYDGSGISPEGILTGGGGAAAALVKKEIFAEIHVFHFGISWVDFDVGEKKEGSLLTKAAAGRTVKVVKRFKIENIKKLKVKIKVYLYVSYLYKDL